MHPRHTRRANRRPQFAGGWYLEGQGDLVSRLIIRIPRVSIWFIRVINLLTKSA